MSLVDETIRLDIRKQDASIIRNGAVVAPPGGTTYMVAEATGMDAGRRRLDPFYDYESFARFPSVAALIAGDIVLSDSIYYLVMALEQKICEGENGYFRATLYKCNAIVSVYYFNTTTKKHDTLHASSVNCLITPARALQEWDEDRALINRQYRGRQAPFLLFAQDESGIVSNIDCVVIDASNRRLRVSKEVDVFVADGISQCQVLWER